MYIAHGHGFNLSVHVLEDMLAWHGLPHELLSFRLATLQPVPASWAGAHRRSPQATAKKAGDGVSGSAHCD